MADLARLGRRAGQQTHLGNIAPVPSSLGKRGLLRANSSAAAAAAGSAEVRCFVPVC